MSAAPPWVIVKFGDQVAPNLEAGASMSLAELAQHFEDVLVAGALDGVRGLGIELEFARAWEPVTPQQLQELVDRADAAEPPDELVNMEAFLRVVVPDRVDPQTLLDVLNAATDAVEVAYIGSPVGLPSVVDTTNQHFTALGYLQPSPLGVDAIRAWELGADGSGVSIIDVETGFYFEHRDLPVVPFLAGENSEGGKYHGAAVLGVLVAKDNAFGGVGLAPAASCSAMSYTSAAGDSEPPELAARIVEAALTLSAGDVLVVEAQLFAELDGRDDTPVPAETDLQVFRAIWHATRLGIVVVEAAGNGSSNVDHYTDPHSGAHILDPTSGDFRDSGAIIVGAATSTLPRTKEPLSNFGGFIATAGANTSWPPARSPRWTSHRRSHRRATGRSTRASATPQEPPRSSAASPPSPKTWPDAYPTARARGDPKRCARCLTIQTSARRPPTQRPNRSDGSRTWPRSANSSSSAVTVDRSHPTHSSSSPLSAFIWPVMFETASGAEEPDQPRDLLGPPAIAAGWGGKAGKGRRPPLDLSGALRRVSYWK